ncbi:MAG: 2Fe-2S iron-sulfur cluster-binding protein [Rhizobiaceae bacterium]
MAAPKFHTLTIAEIRHPSAGSTAIKFGIPDAMKSEFEFVPGQYLTLRATVDGEDIRRSYSICSAQSDPQLEVGIKQVEGGKFSNFATTLQVGDTLQIMPPQGRFTAQIEPNQPHDYLLLAAGSGITPCLSIAKSVLKQEPDSTITLVYGNQSTATVMFRQDINALKDRYTGRLRLFYSLSREPSDLAFLNGRLNGEMVAALAEKKLIDLNGFDAAFICGPHEMIEDVSTTLRNLKMAEERIKVELFTTGDMPAPRPAKRATRAVDADGIEVAIILDGKRNSLQMDPNTETVLAAAQEAGLDLPFSCAGGMCCTCRCKIVEGEAAMDVNYSLQDWEIEAGFTLACQSRPVSKNLVLDFDAT